MAKELRGFFTAQSKLSNGKRYLLWAWPSEDKSRVSCRLGVGSSLCVCVCVCICLALTSVLSPLFGDSIERLVGEEMCCWGYIAQTTLGSSSREIASHARAATSCVALIGTNRGEEFFGKLLLLLTLLQDPKATSPGFNKLFCSLSPLLSIDSPKASADRSL